MSSFRIVVPATSANLGPGFDSLGLALGLYLTVDASPSDKWTLEQYSRHLPQPVTVENHLIVSAARQTAAHWDQKLSPCDLSIRSDIPLAKGLGSSASAIVAGIELANQICSLSLTTDEKLAMGTLIEGHPDNITPAVMGGLVASAAIEKTIEQIVLPLPDVDAVMAIPDEEIATEISRDVLPAVYTRKQAASASAISNILIAALAAGDYVQAGNMMEQDLFHEPYRRTMLTYYDIIRHEASICEAYGTVISGAGPAMMSWLPKAYVKLFINRLQNRLPDCQVMHVKPESRGVLTYTNV